jgi:hypothetical protein
VEERGVESRCLLDSSARKGQHPGHLPLPNLPVRREKRSRAGKDSGRRLIWMPSAEKRTTAKNAETVHQGFRALLV